MPLQCYSWQCHSNLYIFNNNNNNNIAVENVCIPVENVGGHRGYDVHLHLVKCSFRWCGHQWVWHQLSRNMIMSKFKTNPFNRLSDECHPVPLSHSCHFGAVYLHLDLLLYLQTYCEEIENSQEVGSLSQPHVICIGPNSSKRPAQHLMIRTTETNKPVERARWLRSSFHQDQQSAAHSSDNASSEDVWPGQDLHRWCSCHDPRTPAATSQTSLSASSPGAIAADSMPRLMCTLLTLNHVLQRQCQLQLYLVSSYNCKML